MRVTIMSTKEKCILFFDPAFKIYHFPASTGLGIGTISVLTAGCQGFIEPNLSTLLYKSKNLGFALTMQLAV